MDGISLRNIVRITEKPDGFVRETDYRLAAFIAWSSCLSGKRVGIYGTGANARRILENCKTPFEHVVLIDDNAVGVEVCGFEAKDVQHALAQGLDAIVIAAELDAALVIARRIGWLCRHTQVRLYDMYGNEIAEMKREIEAVLAQSLNEQVAVINECDVLCVNAAVLFDEYETEPFLECLHTNGTIDRCLWSLLDYLAAQGKKVIFYCSGLSADSNDIAQELECRGFTGSCEVVASDEVGLWPKSGLYRALYDREVGKRIVHVGSNVFEDCLVPLAFGRQAILTEKLVLDLDFYRTYGIEVEKPQDAVWYAAADDCVSDTPEGRLRACAARVMPHVVHNCGSSAAYAVSIVAPLAIGFTTWLVDRLEHASGEFDGILFTSRDGYLAKEVFDLYCGYRQISPLPPALYFYTSRKASLTAAEGRESESSAYRAYLDYCASCGLELGGSYALVEFVGGGTCQHQLEAFVPFRLKGFSFGSRLGDSLQYRMNAEFYFDDDDASFLARYLDLESYMSAEEPSLAGFASDGTPIFSKELRSEAEIEHLRAVHAGVRLFAKAYFSEWFSTGDVIDHGFLNGLMPGLDACDTDLITLYDDMTGNIQPKDIWSIIPRSDEVSPGESSSQRTMVHEDGVSGRDSALQDKLLILLRVFDEVCREFNLTYIATHGTLLGALRHGGLVPWDDDLDVAMPRADYEKLVYFAEQGVFPEPLLLQTPENDENSFSGGYAKLFLRKAGASECGDADVEKGQDIWMDILPLDDCPLDDAAVERRQRLIRSWQRTLYAQTYGLDMSKLWDVNPNKISAYIILASHMSRAALCKSLKKTCMACKPTGLLTVFAGNYRRQRNNVRFSVADVEQAVRIPFAGMSIPIPRNAEEWLQLHYGENWRDIPDEGWGER